MRRSEGSARPSACQRILEMRKKRNRFSPRTSGKERYKKMFLIATEGARTEPQYFALFKEFDRISSVVHVKCIKKSSGASSPHHVLKAMKNYLSKSPSRNSDEAWLVVDRDKWAEENLAELFAWSQERENYEFAMSNPKFEYWLLLHFKNVKSSLSSSQRSIFFASGFLGISVQSRATSVLVVTHFPQRGCPRFSCSLLQTARHLQDEYFPSLPC